MSVNHCVSNKARITKVPTAFSIIVMFSWMMLAPSHASGIVFESFDVSGASSTIATNLNDTGQIVGLYQDSGGTTHGFSLNGGTFSTIDVLGQTAGQARTEVLGINNAGQMVGAYGGTFSSPAQSFYLSGLGGTFTTINPPGASRSQAFGINSTGQIVGDFNTTQGYFLSGVGGTYTTLQVPGLADTLPHGINDSGQIVGGACAAMHCGPPDVPPGINAVGFFLSGVGGTFTTFDVPGANANSTEALRINNAGQIVGGFSDLNGLHGFLLNGGIGGTFSTINVPGATSTEIAGINNLGQIVGYYTDTHGTHGFLGSPASVPLLPSGLCGGAFCFLILGTGGAPVILDPLVAAGYQYQVTGGSLFASVEVPQIGNSQYALYLWNGTQYVFSGMLPAGSQHFFGPNGVSQFEILGIDPNAGLDPTNPLAFPTTVTFLGTGEEDVTMTPLTTPVTTPEPSTWLLLGSGLAGLAAWRRK